MRASDRRGFLWAAALLALGAAQYAWNIVRVSPLSGYDALGHVKYILVILGEGRLPHPTLGPECAFNPPLYYMLGALAWRALEPLGALAIVVGLRSISAAAWLAAAWTTYRLCRRMGAGVGPSLVALALFLFVPACQLAIPMERNETLAAALSVLALPWLLDLEERPADMKAAAIVGTLAGLAAIAKFSGLWIAAACAIPFLKGRPSRGTLEAAAGCFLVMGAIAAPVYARNAALTGTPLPLSTLGEPAETFVRRLTFRERRFADYLWLDPRCLWEPALFKAGERSGLNPRMTNVWGTTYASAWHDAFSVRVPAREQGRGLRVGRALALIGLIPTALCVLGFAAALAAALRGRAEPGTLPLVGMTLIGLTLFLAYTWRTPPAVSLKASYLTPLAGAAAVFFCRGASLLRGRWGAVGLASSALAALLAGLAFSSHLLFPPVNMRHLLMIAMAFPDAPHQKEAADLLVRAIDPALLRAD